MCKKDCNKYKKVVLEVKDCLTAIGKGDITFIEVFAIIDNMPDEIYFIGDSINWNVDDIQYAELKRLLSNWLDENYCK